MKGSTPNSGEILVNIDFKLSLQRRRLILAYFLNKLIKPMRGHS